MEIYYCTKYVSVSLKVEPEKKSLYLVALNLVSESTHPYVREKDN